MRSIKKLFALVITLGILIFLASCGSSSGIVANMEYTATTTTIKITATFAESEEVKKVTAYIKEYSVDSSGTETYKETKNLSFSNDIYTRANPVEFTGLTKNSKYNYKLYVKTDNYTEEIKTLEASTSNAGDTEENSIEIKTTEDFNNICNNLSAHYTLMNDLDFAGVTLSTAITATSSERFKGTFDGNNKTIKNVTFSSATNIGLFPYTDGATIKNLTVDTVVADFSTGRTTANIGALIGGAESTKVENVTVKNVNFSIQGNSSAELNVGGVVGMSEKSTFTSTKSENVSINFSRSRLKVNVGLFAGVFKSGRSVGKITIEGNEVSLLADKCSGSGKIEAMAYYPSSEGFTHIGGFAGDISSSSLLQDSYSNAEIIVSKDTTSSYANKYSLAVGGFVGCNNGGSMKISKCLSKAAITVTAGVIPTSTNGNYRQFDESLMPADSEIASYISELTAALDEEYNTFVSADYTTEKYASITTTKDAAKNNINNSTTCRDALDFYNAAVTDMNNVEKIVNSTTMTTSSATDKYFACIGGFAGRLHQYIASISDCIYMSTGKGVTVMAKDTQEITEDETTTDVQVLFKSNTVGKNDDAPEKITNLVEWSSTLDISSFGDYVKAFLAN